MGQRELEVLSMETATVLFGTVPEAFKGSGDGYGSGYGSGDGSGYGYGYGSGYGSKEYWASLIPAFAAKWDKAGRTRLLNLQKEGHTIAYWRSNAAGKPCNGGNGGAVYPGLVQTIKGPLALCGDGALHATTIPPQWKGDRIWIVALKGDVKWQDDKCGALCREIIGECLQ